MADVAIGTTCQRCGTLVACAGAFTDEQLVGTCPVCKIGVTTQNIRVIDGKHVPVTSETSAEDAQAGKAPSFGAADPLPDNQDEPAPEQPATESVQLNEGDNAEPE